MVARLGTPLGIVARRPPRPRALHKHPAPGRGIAHPRIQRAARTGFGGKSREDWALHSQPGSSILIPKVKREFGVKEGGRWYSLCLIRR
jgi:hypothetical protein